MASREVPQVIEHPAACPGCGSTERGPKQGVHRALEQGGVDSDGIPYKRVEWFYTTCRSCPQRYSVKRYIR